MRIVFFGNNYHRLSIACLEAVVDTGHEVTLGVFLPESSGLLNTARVAFRHGGVGAVARGGVRLLRARVGAKARAVAGSASGFSSLLEIADRRGLETVDVTHLHRTETLEALRAVTPDLIIVACFSKILKREVIEIPQTACVNIHPSLLPAYRGPNPVYWVVANGERETGVTAHFIDEGIDSGDIIDQVKVSIDVGAGEEDVFSDCVDAAARLAGEVVRQFEEGSVQRAPQDPVLASYFGKPPRGASSL
jgi:methionyl-tRNA formyltransferase